MTITATPDSKLPRKEELTLDVMGMIDEAVEDKKPLSSYKLAEQIVNLISDRLGGLED